MMKYFKIIYGIVTLDLLFMRLIVRHVCEIGSETYNL
jgi:hypothetical protein